MFTLILMDFFHTRSRQGGRAQYSWRRERSMEDLHKDIETIWRELQEIDKMTRQDDKVAHPSAGGER